MKQPRKKASSLSPYRAFVVQFRQETDIAQEHLVGRVEHVVSGQSQRFESLEELLGFMARMLGGEEGDA